MTSNHDFVVPAGENCRRFVVCDASDRYTENGEYPAAERRAYFKALYSEIDNGGIEVSTPE
jgi:hypothetical protein